MKGLSSTPSRNTRSKPTCSFCRSPEHRVTDCPHIKPVWDKLQLGVIPLAYMQSIKPNDTSGLQGWRQNNAYWRSPLASYYTQGANWGDLYRLAEKAYDSWQKAQQKANGKGKSKSKRRALTTCGYCKETGHTRSKCEHLTSHRDMLVKANRNFRKWFYEEYVVKQGLSTGAIVSFEFVQHERWNSPASRVKVQTLVTDINWDSINLLSVLDLDAINTNWTTEVDGAKKDRMDNIRDFLRSKVVLKIPSSSMSKCDVSKSYGYGNEPYWGVNLPMYIPQTQSHRSTKYYELLNFDNHDPIGWGGNRIENVTIVQPAPQVLADNWVDGFSDEMSVIFKKFSMAQLDHFGVIEHIKEWANKTV